MPRSGLYLCILLSVVAVSLKKKNTRRAQVETALAASLISDEQSNQIGEQVHADVQKSGVRYISDPVVRGYVEEIGARIFALAREDRPGVDYHVHLIDDP